MKKLFFFILLIFAASTSLQAQLAWASAEPARSLEYARRAGAAFAARGDLWRQAEVTWTIPWNLYFLGRLDGSMAALAEFERSFTSETGLPGRGWYRHYVYAPGAYTGYGVKTLPAVREALEQRRWDDVNPAADATAKVLAQAAVQLDAAAKLLGP